MDLVALMPDVPEMALPEVRAFVVGPEAAELGNAHYLACLLVWASTAIHLSRDQSATGVPVNREQIVAAALGGATAFCRTVSRLV